MEFCYSKGIKMYKGNGHVYDNKFNSVSDLMERYYNDGARGPRSQDEYRPALRNAARIAYRLAKKLVKAQHQQTLDNNK